MNAVYAQIARGFKGAAGPLGSTKGAGIDLVLQRTPTVRVRAIKNPLPATGDGVDRNQGDDTPCTITALVADPADTWAGRLPAAVPEQGESFTDTDGRRYRIASVEHVPGQPLVHFTIANVVSA